MRFEKFLPKSIKKALRTRLRAKERIVVAMPGFGIFRSRGRWIWPVYFGIFRPPLLMATNKRLIIMARGWFRMVFYGWDLHRITWANLKPGWLVDRVTITVAGVNTHILLPKKIRRASKHLVNQIQQAVTVGKLRKKRRIA
ncbi:MAG: hypothetical protein M1548_09375 [Actinobacteria bacterium]|nr:hypothetical protein [Actinomycetota bacterium]